MGTERRGLSWRGLRRALVRLAAIPLVLLALYVAFAKAGFVHSPFFVITEGDVEEAKSSDPGLRVLFVGNSLTYHNDMPHMLHELAAEDPGAQPIFSVSRTRAGWTLEGATEDEGLDSLLDDVSWDAVILQERSWYLATPESTWRRLTYPYADELRREIEMSGDRPVLFATWGYRDGLGDGDTYGAMQNRLLDGYGSLARDLDLGLVPVGAAWWDARRARPGLDLWADDNHPNRAGSYLAACVFYAEFTGRDPRSSGYSAGLDLADARFLQDQAAATVLAFEELAPGLAVRLVERAGA